jgi:hypothetical protein
VWRSPYWRTLYDRVQLDEVERVRGVLDENDAIHWASLVGLAVNAPAEIPKHEDRFWAQVNQGPPPDAETVLAAATPMIEQLAFLARVARRQRRRERQH